MSGFPECRKLALMESVVSALIVDRDDHRGEANDECFPKI